MDFIPVNEPILSGNEKKYLSECIDTGWISSEGPFVSMFEDQIASMHGKKHGIAVSNGTAAIDIAIESLKIESGDEVIVPAFTIISCVLQIVRKGAIPILVDCDPHTFNINTEEVERKITSKTKAIMVVHIYGLPVNMAPIIKLCKKYNLALIEDAAEAIGQKYLDNYCGSFGDLSTFSFYPNKHITSGEGGMILTDSDELAECCRSLRNLSFIPAERFIHYQLGWNYRMTNLQAAVGVAQFERLNEFIAKKRYIGKFYNEILSDIKKIQLPLTHTDYAENIYWVYGIVFDKSLGSAKSLIAKFTEHGIGTRPFFFPIHQQPILRSMGFFSNDTFPNAEHIYKQGLYIPSGLALTDKQMVKVASVLRDIIRD